jgi:hypothetical protein
VRHTYLLVLCTQAVDCAPGKKTKDKNKQLKKQLKNNSSTPTPVSSSSSPASTERTDIVPEAEVRTLLYTRPRRKTFPFSKLLG